jgi:uncharacterized protein YjiS (DUF1127 family)
LTDLIGYIAASLVFAAFCAKRMVPLRMLAIASNIGFISYGSLLGLWPIVLLHSFMLPINVLRLHQASAVPSGSGRWYQGLVGSRLGLLFETVLRWPARWRDRERLRRELAGMRSRDFGDLAVSPGLIEDEKRRWPWQEWSSQWSAVTLPRHAGEGEKEGDATSQRCERSCRCSSSLFAIRLRAANGKGCGCRPGVSDRAE